MTKFPISAMLTSLPLDFGSALAQVRALGFTHADLVALSERPPEQIEALAESGLLVACVSAGRKLPPGCALDAPGVAERRAAVEEIKRQLADAARLGATHAYVVCGTDPSTLGLRYFAEACGLLADYAGQRMIQFCVEHCPGRALPSVATTLHWLEQNAPGQVKLLLDAGHCLISREDPAEMIAAAGLRLAYVHLDDNDGSGDLHWPLLTGKLTEPMLKAALAALQTAGYNGAVALELKETNPDPVQALAQGKQLIERLLKDMKDREE